MDDKIVEIPRLVPVSLSTKEAHEYPSTNENIADASDIVDLKNQIRFAHNVFDNISRRDVAPWNALTT